MKRQLPDYLQVSSESCFAQVIETIVFPSLPQWDRKLLWKTTFQAGLHRTFNRENMPAHSSYRNRNDKHWIAMGKQKCHELWLEWVIVLLWIISPTSPKLPSKVNKILLCKHHLKLGGTLAKAWKQLLVPFHLLASYFTFFKVVTVFPFLRISIFKHQSKLYQYWKQNHSFTEFS